MPTRSHNCRRRPPPRRRFVSSSRSVSWPAQEQPPCQEESRENCRNHEYFPGPHQFVCVRGGRDRTSRRAGCHFCRYPSHTRNVFACSTMEHLGKPQTPNPVSFLCDPRPPAHPSRLVVRGRRAVRDDAGDCFVTAPRGGRRPSVQPGAGCPRPECPPVHCSRACDSGFPALCPLPRAPVDPRCTGVGSVCPSVG